MIITATRSSCPKFIFNNYVRRLLTNITLRLTAETSKLQERIAVSRLISQSVDPLWRRLYSMKPILCNYFTTFHYTVVIVSLHDDENTLANKYSQGY